MNLAIRRHAPGSAAAERLHYQFDQIARSARGVSEYLAPAARQQAREVAQLRLEVSLFHLRNDHLPEAALELSLAAKCLQSAVFRPLKFHPAADQDSGIFSLLEQAIGFHTLSVELIRRSLARQNLREDRKNLALELKHEARAGRHLYYNDPAFGNAETREWLFQLNYEAAGLFESLGLHLEAFFENSHQVDLLVDAARENGGDLRPAVYAAAKACLQAKLYQGKCEAEIRGRVSRLKQFMNEAVSSFPAFWPPHSASSSPK